MLEIAVHHDYRFTGSCLQTSRQRALLPEIARELEPEQFLGSLAAIPAKIAIRFVYLDPSSVSAISQVVWIVRKTLINSSAKCPTASASS